jgi:excisionase family DNA binding protein
MSGKHHESSPMEEVTISTIATGQPGEAAISISEAAKNLPLSEHQLREAVRRGQLPATKVGRAYYLFPSDIRRSPLGQLWREHTAHC